MLGTLTWMTNKLPKNCWKLCSGEIISRKCGKGIQKCPACGIQKVYNEIQAMERRMCLHRL